MPYKGENSVSMYIFLPESTPTAIDDLLNNLTPEILDDIFCNQRNSVLTFKEVYVFFPKFSLEINPKLESVC